MNVKGKEIENILPHRRPFLFVDEVKIDNDIIKAGYLFKEDEFFFKGHFPQYPVVPGVLLVETMAQAGGVGAVIQNPSDKDESSIFFLASINNVKFRRQVRPNDFFNMEIVTLRHSDKLIKQSGKGFVNGELAVEAEWLCIAGNV